MLEDSGSGAQRIIYEGEPGNLPVISGGAPVTGWVKAPDDLPFLPEAAKGKVWIAKLENHPATLKCLYDADGVLPKN